MTVSTRDAVSRICAESFEAPKLNRIADEVLASDNPIAFSTWDTSSDPEVHADPLAAATPAKSRFISIDSVETPGKLTFKMCGSRSLGCPFTMKSSGLSRFSSSFTSS